MKDQKHIVCPCDHLDEDGICRRCGADRRGSGVGYPVFASDSEIRACTRTGEEQ